MPPDFIRPNLLPLPGITLIYHAEPTVALGRTLFGPTPGRVTGFQPVPGHGQDLSRCL